MTKEPCIEGRLEIGEAWALISIPADDLKAAGGIFDPFNPNGSTDFEEVFRRYMEPIFAAVVDLHRRHAGKEQVNLQEKMQ